MSKERKMQGGTSSVQEEVKHLDIFECVFSTATNLQQHPGVMPQPGMIQEEA